MSEAAKYTAAQAMADHQTIARKAARDKAFGSSAIFPLALFGTVSLAAGILVAATGDLDAYALFWMICGPLGGIAIALWYARADAKFPTPSRVAIVSVAIAVALQVGTIATGVLAGPAVPFLIVGVAYFAFAHLFSSPATFSAAISISIIALFHATGAAKPANPEAILAITCGLAQLVAATIEFLAIRNQPPQIGA